MRPHSISHRFLRPLVIPSLVGLAACGGGADAGGGAGTPLRIAAIPDANKTELAEGFRRVAEYLSTELGVPVEFVPSTTYAASIEAFKNGDVQLAWFGGVSGVQARRAVEGSHAIAQGKVDPEFYSYFIANVDAGVEPSTEFPMGLAGKSFTFGSEGSTSGRVMPEHFIRQATGKSPEEFFGQPNRYSGAHDATARDVEAGTFDAGALSYKKYDSMVAAGELDPAKCVKIWTTPTYPDYNWTAHPVLEERYGEGFTKRVQDALVGMKDPALLAVLLRPEGLIKASDADFAAIAGVMDKVGM